MNDAIPWSIFLFVFCVGWWLVERSAANPCFFNHSWTEWKVIEAGERISTITDGVIGTYLIQQCTCIRCKIKRRTEKTYL